MQMHSAHSDTAHFNSWKSVIGHTGVWDVVLLSCDDIAINCKTLVKGPAFKYILKDKYNVKGIGRYMV